MAFLCLKITAYTPRLVTQLLAYCMLLVSQPRGLFRSPSTHLSSITCLHADRGGLGRGGKRAAAGLLGTTMSLILEISSVLTGADSLDQAASALPPDRF